MKVVRVDSLGDIIAYKPKEIQVLGAIYDKVPEEFLDDFEVVLNTARTKYMNKVGEAKMRGEKPKSALYKKESISEVIKPFLDKFNALDNFENKRVIKTDNPRIPSDDEKITVKKTSILVDTEIDLEDLGSMFDNFESDNLNDEKVEVNLDDDLGTSTISLGSDTDGLFEGDEFDFESLLD